MTSEQQLSEVLSEFARTMVTDFPIQAILDRLVECIVEILPVTSAGVTLISPGEGPHHVAASNADALHYEHLQTAGGAGPCMQAHSTGEAVALVDLRHDPLFPEYARAASEAGLAAVFAFPLRQGTGRLGALDLYRDTVGPLDERDMAAAQTLADVAAAYLLNAQARQECGQAAEALRASSLHDSLTGLPNRVLLEQRLEHAAERAKRSHSNAAVLFADLDGFKQVNDTHGHAVGDALLVAVAQRLSGLLRPGDTLARASGDEFVILCEDLRAAADVEVLAVRIDESFRHPFELPPPVGGGGTLEVSVSASVGMAFAGRTEEIGSGLVQQADVAIYQAKRKGGAGHQVIDLREARADSDRACLQEDLRAALLANDLTLSYQPIVTPANGLLTGVEALLRWTHPVRGPVPAKSMVAVAERNSLILDVGAWVLQRSCEDRMRWLRKHPGRRLDVAVNVSPRQLLGPGFPATVERVLTTTGMDPAALVLEMTEDIFLDSARATAVLADLKGLGVRLALDDFGTGYSSLNYLRDFPVDIVKIDQGFVADLGRTATGRAIVEAVTRLAHVLGLQVTAEGVETAQQHEEVVAIGCESAQGYYYSRPLTVQELSARLDASES